MWPKSTILFIVIMKFISFTASLDGHCTSRCIECTCSEPTERTSNVRKYCLFVVAHCFTFCHRHITSVLPCEYKKHSNLTVDSLYVLFSLWIVFSLNINPKHRVILSVHHCNSTFVISGNEQAKQINGVYLYEFNERQVVS